MIFFACDCIHVYNLIRYVFFCQALGLNCPETGYNLSMGLKKLLYSHCFKWVHLCLFLCLFVFVLGCGSSGGGGAGGSSIVPVSSVGDGDSQQGGGDSEGSSVLALDHEHSLLDVEVGSSVALNALFLNLIESELEWEFQDAGFVSLNVTDEGISLYGVKPGTTLLRVKTSSFSFDDDSDSDGQVLFVTLNVVGAYPDVTGIEILPGADFVMGHSDDVSSSATLSAYVNPTSLLHTAIDWWVDDESIVSLNYLKGKHVVVSSVSRGETDVYARSQFNPDFVDSVHIVVGGIDGLSVSPASLDLTFNGFSGDEGTLVASVSPMGFDSSNVIWSIDDDSVATLSALEDSSSIVVQGLSSGTAIVSVTSRVDDRLVATTSVVVRPPDMTDLSLSLASGTYVASPHAGYSHLVLASVSPRGFYDEELVWESSNYDVVTFNQRSGSEVEVIGLSAGIVTFSVRSTFDPSFFEFVSMEVLELNEFEIRDSENYSDDEIEVYWLSQNLFHIGTNSSLFSPNNVTWSSSNEDVVSLNVSSEGLSVAVSFNALALGTSVVSVFYELIPEIFAQVTVNVVMPPLDSFSLDIDDVRMVAPPNLNNILPVSAAIEPDGFYGDTLAWTSSHPEIVTFNTNVGRNVELMALATGSATIRVTAGDPAGTYEEFVVSVVSPETLTFKHEGVSVNSLEITLSGQESFTLSAGDFTSLFLDNPVTWISLDPSIVSFSGSSFELEDRVSLNGLVLGSTEVVVEYDLIPGLRATLDVSVVAPEMTSLSVSVDDVSLSSSPNLTSTVSVLATVDPNGFYESSLKWSVDDDSIVTIDSVLGNSVVLTGLVSGSTTVRVSSDDDVFEETISVVVSELATMGLVLEGTSIGGGASIIQDEPTTLVVTGNSSLFDGAPVTWQTSSTNVISFDVLEDVIGAGVEITGLKVGTAEVKVIYDYDTRVSVSAVVEVVLPDLVSIDLSADSVQLLVAPHTGSSQSFTAVVNPSVYYNSSLVWETSAPSVVTLSSTTGTSVEFIGLSGGSATVSISSTLDPSRVDTISVSVVPLESIDIYYEGASWATSNISHLSTLTFNAVPSSDLYEGFPVSYHSSDLAVASLNVLSGNFGDEFAIMGLSTGSALITITSVNDPSVVVTRAINVVEQALDWSSEDDFPYTLGISDFGTAVFNDEIWVAGGIIDYQSVYSYDGSSWTKFSNVLTRKVYDAPMVSFGGQLWVLGGKISSGVPTNNIMTSSDGSSWSSVSMTGDVWAARSGLAAVVHGGYIYLIGGNTDGVSVNDNHKDVYRSSDGTDWELMNDDAEFDGRYGHQLVSFGGKLWVLGGFANDGQVYNDIWSSSDGGASWTEETSSAAWDARYLHRVVVHNSSMWLVGGSEFVGVDGSGNVITTAIDDVWKSSDGVNWVEVDIPGGSFGARTAPGVLSFQDKLWVFLGRDDVPSLLKDIYSADLE